ncbi:hypothetical protein [Prochlorococcus sp. MIT 1201]|uniref:hypothetical protein n=1 Tax=Prochlorococcus sp. MIT 1201 TaxID=3082535 RepID=UPI0039A40F55
MLSLTLGGFFNIPLRCMGFGLRADIPESQARSIDPVALLSPRESQHEIQCSSGLGSGLWSRESPEHY